MAPEILTPFVETLLPALGALAAALVSWALAEAARYVRTRTANESVNDALERICHMIETTVARLNQTVVDDIRAAAADGHISREEAEQIRQRALQAVTAQLPERVLQIAARGVNDLTVFIEDRIERTVREQRFLDTAVAKPAADAAQGGR